MQGAILIVFAWMMELVGVSGGVINSTYTTFGSELPTTFAGYLPAVPMVALAVAELGRVPLASAFFLKHRGVQLVAALGIACLSYIAVENWTFGFERIVDMRLAAVNGASRDQSRAETELAALIEIHRRTATNNSQKRAELRRGIDQRDISIAEVTTQLAKEGETYQRNLEAIREACRIIRDKCMAPRSHAEDVRYTAAVSGLNVELDRLRSERKQLQSQIDGVVTADAETTADLDKKVGAAEFLVNETRQAFRKAVDGNQIYRLAASWYGVSTSEVSPEQFATARWVFATFSAIAVAVAGTVAALVYYARTRVPGAPSLISTLLAKIARSRRAYYARKRRPLIREAPGPERVIYRDGKEPPVVIEKEVVRFIDQIFLIPRWGIKAPLHVNSLLNSNLLDTKSSAGRGSAELMSNVMTIGKKAG